jgi:hypothetical protein
MVLRGRPGRFRTAPDRRSSSPVTAIAIAPPRCRSWRRPGHDPENAARTKAVCSAREVKGGRPPRRSSPTGLRLLDRWVAGRFALRDKNDLLADIHMTQPRPSCCQRRCGWPMASGCTAAPRSCGAVTMAFAIGPRTDTVVATMNDRKGQQRVTSQFSGRGGADESAVCEKYPPDRKAACPPYAWPASPMPSPFRCRSLRGAHERRAAQLRAAPSALAVPAVRVTVLGAGAGRSPSRVGPGTWTVLVCVGPSTSTDWGDPATFLVPGVEVKPTTKPTEAQTPMKPPMRTGRS